MAFFKYPVVGAVLFLFFFGTFPVAVSAAYGGKPPPHIAEILTLQSQTFAKASLMFFSAFPWAKSSVEGAKSSVLK